MNDIFTMVKKYMKEGMTEKEAIEEVEKFHMQPVSDDIKARIHEDVNYATTN